MAQPFVAVQRLRQQGHDVDENNDTGVRTYMALREAPPHRVTGDALVESIRWNEWRLGLRPGPRMTLKQDFWAVPRANFPDGLPAVMKNASKESEDYAGAPCRNEDSQAWGGCRCLLACSRHCAGRR